MPFLFFSFYPEDSSIRIKGVSRGNFFFFFFFFFSRKANVLSIFTDNSFKRCYRFERSHLFLRLTGLVDELTRTVNPPGRVRRSCVHCQDFDVVLSISVDCVCCPGFIRFLLFSFFFFLSYQTFYRHAIQTLKVWYLFEKFYV